MVILFLGDVVGEPGRCALYRALPELRAEFAVDAVVVNGENAAGGKGIIPRLARANSWNTGSMSSPWATMYGINLT